MYTFVNSKDKVNAESKSRVTFVTEAAVSAKGNLMMYAVGANGTSEDFRMIGSDFCRLYSIRSVRDELPYAVPDLASGICSGKV